MTRRLLLVVAIAVLVRNSFAFVVDSVGPSSGGRGGDRRDIVARIAMAAAPIASSLDSELEFWASSSGYGSVATSTPAGSSDWASFRRVTVSNPPRIGDDIDDEDDDARAGGGRGYRSS